MSLITRQGKGSKLTIQEMDGNLEYLEGLAQGGGTIPVETVYPTTDALKAGTRFWYKGNEWHYMTQAEIDSTGWTGLVSVGFPAPVSKVPNVSIFYGNTTTSPNPEFGRTLAYDATELNFLGFGLDKSRVFNSFFGNRGLGGATSLGVVNTVRNANLLTFLEDVGTAPSLFLGGFGLTENAINDLFTQLPLTTKTATINVNNNPGSATCDPTIATAKGYTVVT
jgi:hypothetical protein